MEKVMQFYEQLWKWHIYIIRNYEFWSFLSNEFWFDKTRWTGTEMFVDFKMDFQNALFPTIVQINWIQI